MEIIIVQLFVFNGNFNKLLLVRYTVTTYSMYQINDCLTLTWQSICYPICHILITIGQ